MKNQYLSFKFDDVLSDQQKADDLSMIIKYWRKVSRVTKDVTASLFDPIQLVEIRAPQPVKTDGIKSPFSYAEFCAYDKSTWCHSKVTSGIQEAKFKYFFSPIADRIKSFEAYTIPHHGSPTNRLEKGNEIYLFDLGDPSMKEGLLENLDTVREKLLDTDHLVLRNLGKSIVNHLDKYETSLDDSHIRMAMSAVCEFREFAEESISVVYKIRKFYFKRIIGRIGRDLRQSFRNLVRFLFKNLDDNSGDHDRLVNASRKQSSWIFNLNCHDKNRYYPTPGKKVKKG
jgi:hypothetical protein